MPLFRPLALGVSLRPSSARRLPTAPYIFVFDPTAPDPPLLLMRCNRIRPGSWHLRFALGTMNLRPERNVGKQNDSAPFLHDWMFPLFCVLIVRLSSLVSFPLFFLWGIFSLVYLQLFPFSKYASMAPLINASPFYCELCDRTFVPGANLEEHRVRTIRRGLLEASIKMTGC